MARFAYTARENSGAFKEGLIEAVDRSAAVRSLTQGGLFICGLDEIRTESGRRLARLWRRRVPLPQLAGATRQLGDLLRSGLSLIYALEILSKEVSNARLRQVFSDLKDHVEEGEEFSRALRRFPGVFSPLYASMAASGESVGCLPDVLDSLGQRLEAESEIKRKFNTVLIYPTVLLVMGVITSILLVTFVIPRMAAMYTEMGQELPGPTQLLVSLSGFATSFGWLLVIGLILVVWGVKRIWRRPQVRSRIDGWLLKLPVLGRLLAATEISRFSRMTATLLNGGLSLLVALDVVEDTATNHHFRRGVQSLRRDVAEGLPLSEAMRRSGTFPLSSSHVVAVGEDANDPASALEKVGAVHYREVEEALRLVSTLAEPILVILVGLVVGFIVFAMMLPIFQMDITGFER